MADGDSTTETVEPGITTEVAPGGGIVTRTDGSTHPVPTDWRAGLPPELQAEKSLESFKDVGALAKGFVETKRMVGKGLDVPGKDAKPEQITEYRKRAGIPDKPEGYQITLPKPPEGSGMEIDQKTLSGYLSRMHAAHARPEIVQAGLDYYAEHMATNWDRWRNLQAESEQTDLSGTITELEKKWGPKDGPMWKHHAARAELAIRTLMADAPLPAVQRIVESANDPEVADAFSQLADSLIERGFLGEDELPSGMSMEDAQAKADAMNEAARNDPNHPLKDEHHPEHAKVLKQYLEWNAQAAGPRGREVVASVMR